MGRSPVSASAKAARSLADRRTPASFEALGDHLHREQSAFFNHCGRQHFFERSVHHEALFRLACGNVPWTRAASCHVKI
jgi:hypothetical protein